MTGKPELFTTLKAARAAGFHDRSLDEYGGETFVLKGHTLVRNPERARSRTEWHRLSRRVLAGAAPHCLRSANFGGKVVDYDVFRLDQTEAKPPVKPRRKVSPEEREQKRLAVEQKRLAAEFAAEQRRLAAGAAHLETWLATYPCKEQAIAEAVWVLNNAFKEGCCPKDYRLKDKWILAHADRAVQRLARVEEHCYELVNLYEVEIECCGRLYLYHTYQRLPCYQGEKGKSQWTKVPEWRNRLPSGLTSVTDFGFLADWLREDLMRDGGTYRRAGCTP